MVQVFKNAHEFDGRGGIRLIEGEPAVPHDIEGPQIWLHLERENPAGVEWLRERSGIDPLVVENLLSDSNRPRVLSVGEGVFLTLRGVNLNPGADPDDMISLRFWIEKGRLVTVRREKLISVVDVADTLRAGRGPRDVGEMVVALIDALTSRMAPVLDGLSETLDDMEDRVVDPDRTVDRMDLVRVRRQIIAIQRFLTPQVTALTSLLDKSFDPFLQGQRKQLRESIERVSRYIEDLDAARGRAVVIQDELANQFAERLNRRTYTVTVFATVLLPATLLTGLLGVNVAGIPGADDPAAFWILCGSLAGLGLIGVLIARYARWL